MHSTNLHPPNIDEMSDKVTGNITHPTWEPRDTPDNGAIPHGECPGPYSRGRQGYKQTASVSPGKPSAQRMQPVTARTTRTMGPWVRATTDQRRKSTSSWNKALQSIAILQASGHKLDEQQQRAIMEEARKKEDRHRCLQASYKRKEKEAIARKERDVRSLRFAVHELQQQVDSMHLGTQPKLNHGIIATTYQQHFNAFVADEATQKSAATGFLLCIMSPEATRDPVYGVEAILESWSVIAAHFDEIHLKLSDLKTHYGHTGRNYNNKCHYS